MNYIKILNNGIVKENPTFVLLLGMCPTLATTTSARNGLSMGLATMAVLICTNFVISCIKSLTPDKVRIPVFVVVIASFVTVLQLIIKAYLPEIDKDLGIFIPLIVVNCIILGRAEAFACKHTPLASIFDGIGIGLGFTMALTFLGMVRELWRRQPVWCHHPARDQQCASLRAASGRLHLAWLPHCHHGSSFQ